MTDPVTLDAETATKVCMCLAMLKGLGSQMYTVAGLLRMNECATALAMMGKEQIWAGSNVAATLLHKLGWDQFDSPPPWPTGEDGRPA